MRITRRHVLRRLGWAGMVAGAGGFLAAAGRFSLPGVNLEDTTQAGGGRPEDLRLGFPRFVEANRTWLLRDEAGVLALSALCTHLGCTVRWENGAFACPCHGSTYDSSGQVTRGPAPMPLQTVWVGLSTSGDLIVDRGRPVPASFRLAA